MALCNPRQHRFGLGACVFFLLLASSISAELPALPKQNGVSVISAPQPQITTGPTIDDRDNGNTCLGWSAIGNTIGVDYICYESSTCAFGDSDGVLWAGCMGSSVVEPLAITECFQHTSGMPISISKGLLYCSNPYPYCASWLFEDHRSTYFDRFCTDTTDWEVILTKTSTGPLRVTTVERTQRPPGGISHSTSMGGVTPTRASSSQDSMPTSTPTSNVSKTSSLCPGYEVERPGFYLPRQIKRAILANFTTSATPGPLSIPSVMSNATSATSKIACVALVPTNIANSGTPIPSLTPETTTKDLDLVAKIMGTLGGIASATTCVLTLYLCWKGLKRKEERSKAAALRLARFMELHMDELNRPEE